ncbi:hypothetical protein ACN47E_000017 [Coniothyrium glycines]
MGNSFGFLHVEAEGGFQFTVVDACKAAAIDLDQTCSLTFSGQELTSIGNVARGELEPKPGISGIGIWFAMMIFFGVVAIAVVFILLEILFVTKVGPAVSGYFSDQKKGLFRAAGRTFVLGVADTQTIFVGAFLLGFAGQSKCQLTGYHFTVAVNQMMIALSVSVFSVALVRTYWRNPLAAAFRLILSAGCFVGVGLTIFRKANYAPDWPPPDARKDSAILLPVACLLETDLRSIAEAQAEQAGADLGFGSSLTWPVERYFFIALVIAFLIAHLSNLLRFAERRDYAPARWNHYRRFVTVIYWSYMIVPPTFTSVWCWVRVYRTRDWVNKSGWIARPNPEMIIWDQGQLFAMGVLVTIVMNVLTEAYKREGKDERKGGGSFEQVGGDERSESYPMVSPRESSAWNTAYDPYRSS